MVSDVVDVIIRGVAGRKEGVIVIDDDFLNIFLFSHQSTLLIFERAYVVMSSLLRSL